ncbi:MAG: UDP-N-acetylmuramoyl-L-alanyl-D-glutamate--2,6-diaminopimelate ligase [Acidimicrobiales bacterium]
MRFADLSRVAYDIDESVTRRASRNGADVEITHMTGDSRAVRDGSLFCCVPGALFDGHDFAARAVSSGARALLCERELPVDVAQIVVRNVRATMGPMASALYGHPSRSLPVVGVTGTNGKTTTVHLIAAILSATGRVTEVLGTLRGQRTTPEAPELQQLLAQARDDNRQAVAMEVSSHALAQHRVDGTRFAAAVFTNLSADHLDYHRTMEEYFRAKARLFEPSFTDIAVIDVDTTYGRLLADSVRLPVVVRSGASTVDVLSVGLADSAFRWRDQVVRLPLGGRFNVANAVLAADTTAALDVAPDAIASALATVTPVPGRFERIDEGQSFTVLVDYAHTPDGLTRVLEAAREAVLSRSGGDGRVIVVFGCGGDRDATKRPMMGAEAEAGADLVVLTSDNPRHEGPQVIADAVLRGMNERPFAVELDRRRAIALALDAATEADVVVIAGKGHETTQQIGDTYNPFDDREVARDVLRGLGHTRRDDAGRQR